MVGGPPAGRGGDGADRDRRRRRPRRRLASREGRGRGRCLAQRPASGRPGAGGRVAPVHRRGPVRDSGHRPQPRHVPAPVRRRPPGRVGHRAPDRLGLSAGAACAGRGPSGHGPQPSPSLRRNHGRDGRDRRPGVAGAAGTAQRVSARRGGAAGRVRLHDRVVPDPGRVQGDDAGAVPAGVRDRPGAARAGAPGRRRAGQSRAACGAGHRRGLRLQLPWADLACGGRGRVGGRRGPGRLAVPRPARDPADDVRGRAAGPRGAGRLRRRGRPGAGAHRRIREVRDLRP